MNRELLGKWLHAMIEGLPHGGKKLAASKLGISPSALSKLVNEPGRGFDEKTIRCIAWMMNSKSENYSTEQFPIKKTVTVSGLLLQTRELPNGDTFLTWTAADKKKPK